MQKEESLKRQKEFREMYIDKKLSYEAIAKKFGITKQRVQQIIHYDYGTPLTKREKLEKKRYIGKKATKEYYIRQRETIINALGGICCKCGNSDYRVLQIDHINGGGVKEILTKGQWKYRVDILEMIKDGNVHTKYQLLCANCNWIKRHENHEFGRGRNSNVELT